MSDSDSELPVPLSEWEESLYAHFTQHTNQEVEILSAYRELAEHSPNEFVRYLTGMLLEDETRHHRMFRQLTNAIVSEASLTRVPDDVPPVTRADDAAELQRIARRLAELEEEDQAALARLRKELKPVRDTTLWDLLVQLAERDTEKHLLILRFIADAAKNPVAAS